MQKPGVDGSRFARRSTKVIAVADVVEEAAKNRVAVNPHEPVKDTGLRRTYLNWAAREGARGMEYNAWGPFNTGPDHEPTLVYTRMLAGPMDFTPGVLSLTGFAVAGILRGAIDVGWRSLAPASLRPGCLT